MTIHDKIYNVIMQLSTINSTVNPCAAGGYFGSYEMMQKT